MVSRSFTASFTTRGMGDAAADAAAADGDDNDDEDDAVVLARVRSPGGAATTAVEVATAAFHLSARHDDSTLVAG